MARDFLKLEKQEKIANWVLFIDGFFLFLILISFYGILISSDNIQQEGEVVYEISVTHQFRDDLSSNVGYIEFYQFSDKLNYQDAPDKVTVIEQRDYFDREQETIDLDSDLLGNKFAWKSLSNLPGAKFVQKSVVKVKVLKPWQYEKVKGELEDDFYPGYSSIFMPTLITELASQLHDDRLTIQENAKKVLHWIDENIVYDLEFGNEGALSCLVHKRGVCSDYADLMVCLLNTMGIKARKVIGLTLENSIPIKGVIYQNDKVSFHAWVEYHDPEAGWFQCDPTWGKNYFNKLDLIHIAWYNDFACVDDLICQKVGIMSIFSRFEISVFAKESPFLGIPILITYRFELNYSAIFLVSVATGVIRINKAINGSKNKKLQKCKLIRNGRRILLKSWTGGKSMPKDVLYLIKKKVGSLQGNFNGRLSTSESDGNSVFGYRDDVYFTFEKINGSFTLRGYHLPYQVYLCKTKEIISLQEWNDTFYILIDSLLEEL